jgi:hypothetical protein
VNRKGSKAPTLNLQLNVALTEAESSELFRMFEDRGLKKRPGVTLILREWMEENRPSRFICKACSQAPAMDGTIYCQSCFDRLRAEALQKNPDNRDERELKPSNS